MGMTIKPQANLFSGILLQSIVSFPCAGAYFFGYEFGKSMALEYRLSFMAPFIGAFSAEMCSNILRNPFELVKTKLQLRTEVNIIESFSGILSTNGVRGLYIGFISMMLREIPFSCIQMPLYEFIKSQFKQNEQTHLKAHQTIICGFLAGGISAFLTNPNDVIKTNIMGVKCQPTNYERSGVFETGKSLYQNHGIRVFWRGSVYRFFHVGFMSISFFFGYETSKKYWTRWFDE